MNSSATTSDPSTETATGTAIRVRKNPAGPSINAAGRNTITVVSVDIVIASATSPAPLMQESRRDIPSRRRRWMFSATTTELSTSSPIQIIRPINDSRLSDSPAKYMTVRPMTRLIGIEKATIRVSRTRRMKKNRTILASTPPNSPLLVNVPRLSSMISP